MSYLWIALGSALGGVGRHWVVSWAAHKWEGHYPWGTLLVNVTGSFLIGVVAGFLMHPSRPSGSPTLQDFLMVGVMGGYTTFSSFSLQTLNLMISGRWAYAVTYVTLSFILCLAGVGMGYGVVRWLQH